MHIGLLSDTHGLLRPEALAALGGDDALIHAGDIGGALGEEAILSALASFGPVYAIRGNNDLPRGAASERLRLTLGGVSILVVHDVNELSTPYDADVVVCGHSHRPSVTSSGRTLVVNPGSAGPRRFSLPVSVGRLILGDGPPRAELTVLDLGPRAPGRSASRPPRPR
ncbi:metallophosphatase family protein [Myxococcota bacterium]|nr:metallophosphatase family protein [Myxococcota bacterium]